MSTTVDRAPARSATRDLAQIAVFAALIVVLGLPGQISIGSAGVPITLVSVGPERTQTIVRTGRVAIRSRRPASATA